MDNHLFYVSATISFDWPLSTQRIFKKYFFMNRRFEICVSKSIQNAFRSFTRDRKDQFTRHNTAHKTANSMRSHSKWAVYTSKIKDQQSMWFSSRWSVYTRKIKAQHSVRFIWNEQFTCQNQGSAFNAVSFVKISLHFEIHSNSFEKIRFHTEIECGFIL